MNRFYTLPRVTQWTIALLMLVVGMSVFGFFMTFYHPYSAFLHFPISLPLAHLALTPILTLAGSYKYYSPMLLVYNPNPKKYDIHQGTSFDYLMVMRWSDRGLTARKKIWKYFLEGFIRIAEEIEAGNLPPTLQIEGTSYFFSKQTAERLGFRLEPPSALYRLNLIINYIDLCWMYSFAQNRLAFPRVLDAHKAVINGKDLLERKAYFEKLIQRLN